MWLAGMLLGKVYTAFLRESSISPTVFSAAFVHKDKGNMVNTIHLNFQKHQPMRKSKLQITLQKTMQLSHLSGGNYTCPLKRQQTFKDLHTSRAL